MTKFIFVLEYILLCRIPIVNAIYCIKFQIFVLILILASITFDFESFLKGRPASFLSKRLCEVFLQYQMGKKLNRIGKIPAFIKKLKDILEDKSLSDTIEWLPEGNGFQILNTTSFTDKVLPLHFKHKNIASFVRQLNMYGFNRPKDSGQNIYIHPRFLKGNLNSMKLIKRKAGHQRDSSDQSSSGQSNIIRKSCGAKEQKQVSEYQKLLTQNQALRKQNQDLINKLSIFEGMMQKIKLYTQKIEKHIQLAEETQNDKIQKQASASNFSNSSTESLTPFNFSTNRKGFSLCSSRQSPHYESSYQILLQGQNSSDDKKKD